MATASQQFWVQLITGKGGRVLIHRRNNVCVDGVAAVYRSGWESEDIRWDYKHCSWEAERLTSDFTWHWPQRCGQFLQVTSKPSNQKTGNWQVCVEKRRKCNGRYRAMKEINTIARMLKITEISGWDNYGKYVILQGVWLKLIIHEVFLAGLWVKLQ